MFEERDGGEVTQVEFWNLYLETFQSRQDENGMLVAQDVIKGVNTVWPAAQAMVVPASATTSQRFVVRGVDRKKDFPGPERFVCKWERSQCNAPLPNSGHELYSHLLEHISFVEDQADHPCLWAGCPVGPLPKAALKSHMSTHLPTFPVRNAPSQSTAITMHVNEQYQYPMKDPTLRTIPPPGPLQVPNEEPVQDPTSTALTALLCIRVLYRASFTVTNTNGPKADGDHFGFPGGAGDEEDDEHGPTMTADTLRQEQQAQAKGRQAFGSVRVLMQRVRILDEILQSWIDEMVDDFET